MEKIPVRQIKTARKEPDFSGSFTIRDLAGLLGGQDMIQELHRHDFYYLLVLVKASGSHEIDFSI